MEEGKGNIQNRKRYQILNVDHIVNQMTIFTILMIKKKDAKWHKLMKGKIILGTNRKSIIWNRWV